MASMYLAGAVEDRIEHLYGIGDLPGPDDLGDVPLLYGDHVSEEGHGRELVGLTADVELDTGLVSSECQLGGSHLVYEGPV